MTGHVSDLAVHLTGKRCGTLHEDQPMRAAREVGLPTAEVEYREFETEPAIVVKRYDRVRDDAGRVLRLHQEDLCQALGISPSLKYAEQGGPSTPQIISLLAETGASSRENVYQFVLYLYFNYLIGATDGHAKNHSIVFLGEGDMRLAPLYDVASIAPYRSLKLRRRKPLRAALSIGGENRFGAVGKEQVVRMVQTCGLEELGLSADVLCERLGTMARLVPDAVDEVLSGCESAGFDGVGEIAPPMSSEIRANCERTLSLL